MLEYSKFITDKIQTLKKIVILYKKNKIKSQFKQRPERYRIN